MARASKISSATTGAIVTCSNPRFEDANGFPHPNFVTITINVVFNGFAEELGDNVTYARGVIQATKQAAVRAKVNQQIGIAEPGVTLSNANIEIDGLPT